MCSGMDATVREVIDVHPEPAPPASPLLPYILSNSSFFLAAEASSVAISSTRDVMKPRRAEQETKFTRNWH